MQGAVVSGQQLDPGRVAAAFYSLTFVAINVAWAGVWQAIVHRADEVAPELTDHHRRTVIAALWVGLSIYATAFIFSPTSRRISSSFFRFASAMGASGERTASFGMMPSIFIAVFTGIGLDSMKLPFISGRMRLWT